MHLTGPWKAITNKVTSCRFQDKGKPVTGTGSREAGKKEPVTGSELRNSTYKLKN
jgi:hypothetical protein